MTAISGHDITHMIHLHRLDGIDQTHGVMSDESDTVLSTTTISYYYTTATATATTTTTTTTTTPTGWDRPDPRSDV